MNFKPYADKIIIKPIKKEKSDGGIILTETQDMEHLIRGEVVAVSDGFLLGDKEWPLTSKIGDIVWFQKGLGVSFPFEGEEYQILQEGTVFGKETKIKDFKTDRPNVIPVEGQ